MPSKTERVIAGRYALEAPVGRGAMGAVWKAEDRVLQRSVAIKEVEFPPAIPSDEREALEARVMREARAAARLAHPAAVTVFDVVEEDSRPWIVMEYLDAPTLDQVVERDGALNPQRAARIGLDLLAVLEAAHAEGIVHRDVKPGNVMCLADGHAKLGDFGIASLQDDPKITSTGLILGSPSFMAPEQAQSDRPGPAVDMWGLGATLYFAVQGQPPFDKGQAIPTLTAVIDEEPRSPGSGPVGDVIMRMLEKDPEQRVGTEEARTALETIATDGAVSTQAATLPQERSEEGTRAYTRAAPTATPSRSTDERPAVARREPPSDTSWNRWAIALMAVAALFLALFLIPPLFDDDGEERGGRRDPQGRGGGQEAGAGVGTGTVEEPEPAEAPEGWATYTQPATGWSIAYPEGWTVTENPIDGDSIDFSDEEAGSYLRIDWTSEPGDDVMESLAAQEEDFAAEHDEYAQVQLTETEFQGYEAGLWEYTYFDEVDLHAYNLQFVTGEHGFALNFQTHEENWAESQELWEQFQATFVAPQ